MLESLTLPPVAQVIAVVLGVGIAITRLLTASRPFWDRTPAWLQKAIPSLLVAAGLLPQALSQAKTWLDVVEAGTFVVGAYFTASRGDKRASVDKDGGPREARTNTDPEPTQGPRSIPPGPLLVLLVAGLALGQARCAGSPKLPQHPDAACSDENYAKLMGACGAEAASCVAKGGTEEACGAVCDDDADRWQEKCQ